MRKMAHGIGHGGEQRIEPLVFLFGKVMQHVVGYRLLDAGVANPDADSLIVVANVGGNRAQAIVAGIAATGFHFQPAGRQVDLVVKHVDVADRDLEEAKGFADGLSALVHVGGGP